MRRTRGSSSTARRKLRPWRLFETLQLIVAAILLVVIVVVCAEDWNAFGKAQQDSFQIQSTIEGLALLRSLVKDAETGQRGYLLTGQTSYLTPYVNAVDRIDPQLNSLRKSVSAGIWNQLQQHTQAKLRELKKTIEVRRTGDFAGALRIIATDEGHQEMVIIRRLLDQTIQQEHAELSAAQRAASHAANQTLLTAVGGSAALFVFLCFSSVSIGRIAAKRVRAIAALQVSRAEKEEARQVLESSLISIGDAVITTDLDGKIQFMNHVAERLTGWNAAAAKGMALAEVFHIVHEDTKEKMESPAEKVKRLGSVVGLANHTILISKTGQEIPIDDSGAPILGRGGVTTGVVLVFRDITERRESEIALQRSESRYRELANSLPQMVWTADGDGTITYGNDGWRRFMGLAGDELPYTDWSRVLHGADLDTFLSDWERAREKRSMFEIECQLRSAQDNKPYWFLGRAVPLLGREGNVRQWIGTFTDIHERKQAETALQQANENLNQFAFSASHDLQEPLRTLLMFTQLFVRKNKGRFDGDSDQLITTVLDSAHRLERLIHDLLAYVQTAATPGEITERTDANGSLEKALSNLQVVIAETSAVVTSSPLPVIGMADLHLQQVFQNLIGNALKYRSEKPPEIRVAAERRVTEWVLSVEDNGIGIAPEYSKQIFGIFKRLHRNSEYEGTGIGLAICQKILDRYDGRIWVESELGKGSKFLFSVPEYSGVLRDGLARRG